MIKTFKILFLITIISFTSCKDTFEYSPYAIDFDEENSNVNQKSINRIVKNTKTENDTIRIIFTGDTHRAFDEFDNFVTKANSIDYSNPIDFVIHQGDISDFGLPKLYLWGNSYLLKLNVAYLVVLGNHGLVGNGGDSYKKMFGEYNFSFIYGDIKFIFINTNGLESGFKGDVPDINWLDSQLKPNSTFKRAIVVFPIPNNIVV